MAEVGSNKRNKVGESKLKELKVICDDGGHFQFICDLVDDLIASRVKVKELKTQWDKRCCSASRVQLGGDR